MHLNILHIHILDMLQVQFLKKKKKRKIFLICSTTKATLKPSQSLSTVYKAKNSYLQ